MSPEKNFDEIKKPVCFWLIFVVLCCIIDTKELVCLEFHLPPSQEGKARIVQELVPGKQVTLAHIIASPDPVVYQKLGLDPSKDYSRSAIGILSMSPAEISVIAGDLAVKTADIELGFIDRFSGTLIFTGNTCH